MSDEIKKPERLLTGPFPVMKAPHFTVKTPQEIQIEELIQKVKSLELKVDSIEKYLSGNYKETIND